MNSLEALKKIKEADVFVDFETNGVHTLYEEMKEDFDIIQEDLEILEILKEYMFFVPSYYVNQANWGDEHISMAYMDKNWTSKEIYNKVKEWCFKNDIRGTKDEKKETKD